MVKKKFLKVKGKIYKRLLRPLMLFGWDMVAFNKTPSRKIKLEVSDLKM